jgi:flagellar operon protein
MSGIERVGPVGVKPEVHAPRPRSTSEKGGENFQAVLGQACERHQLKFSKHAMDRLETRRVALESGDLDRLGSAVSKADQKGARESLVLLDELAFVVSVRNRTVITAMPSSKDGIFTSIDSAVIA